MSYLPSDSKKGSAHFAYVSLKLGNYNATPIPPKHLNQFSYERVSTGDRGNKVLVTLIDSTALALEYELTLGNREMTFSYGYINGKSSKEYSATISEYGVDFDPQGTSLSIEAVSTGVSSSSTNGDKSATYKNMTIDEIVKYIANEEGWNIASDSIEPCKPIYETTDSSNTTTNGKLIIIGDSRTHGIAITKGATSQGNDVYKYGNTYFVCKDGQGYKWLSSTGGNTAKSLVDSNSTIIFWLGVNDLDDADKYATYVGSAASSWGASSIYYAEISKCTGKYAYLNSKIDSFNKKLKSSLSGVSWLNVPNNLQTTDGLHYNSSSYNRVYNTMSKSANTVVIGNSKSSKGKQLKTYYRASMNAMQFINQVLAKEAVSAKTGEGGYKLWFDDTVTNGVANTTVYFKPTYTSLEYENSDNDVEVVSENDNLFGRSIPDDYRFEYNQGKKGTVIEFSPEYQLATKVNGSSQIEAEMLDSIKNELVKVKYDKSSNPNKIVTGDKDIDDQVTTYKLKGSSCSFEELQNIAATMWYTMRDQVYPATLTIIGDPSLEVQKYCSVLIMLSNGLMHHSSGVYKITSIVDDITAGTFNTKLSLVRNALTIGTNESGGINISARDVEYTGTSDTLDESGSTDSAGTSDNVVTLSGNQANDLISVAASQIGYKEGPGNNTKYGTWYGMNNQPWCAMFVSWCAHQANIPESIIPKYASCNIGMQWFQNKGRFKSANSTPSPGDIIFFGSSYNSHHTGIVESVEGTTIHTIEGNTTSDCCARRTYTSRSSIAGFGSPNYSN